MTNFIYILNFKTGQSLYWSFTVYLHIVSFFVTLSKFGIKKRTMMSKRVVLLFDVNYRI